MKNKKRTLKGGHRADAFDKVLVWIGILLAFELFLLAVYRYCFRYRSVEIPLAAALYKALFTLIFVGLAAAAASAVWAYVGRRGKSKLLPAAVGSFAAAISLASLLARQYGAPSVQALQVMVPAVGVLALIYHLYQREFFFIAALGGLSIVGFWLYRRSFGGHTLLVYGYMGGLIVLSAAAAVLAAALRKGDGTLRWGEVEIRILPRNASYAAPFLSCALTAALIAATLAAGAAVAYGAIFVVTAWIFVTAVYYTVRLM